MNQLTRPRTSGSAEHLLTLPTQPFSAAERERRYSRIRQGMEAQGIDVLILPATTNRWEQSMADSRYVTGIGGFGTETLTVFPRDNEPTAYLFNRAAHWKNTQGGWFRDVRDGQNKWASNAIDRLWEIGFMKGKIGISGMGFQTRTPEGIAPHGLVAGIQKAFPNATIVDASEIIQAVRSQKSQEEVDVMTHAAAITDRMVERMAADARSGVNERYVYAGIVHTMLAEGGDLPALTIFGSGKDIGHGQFVPTNRIMQRGDIIVNELEGRVCGYGVQTVAPVSIGTPSEEYREAVGMAQASYERMVELLKPGVTIGEVIAGYKSFIEKEGRGTYSYAMPTMHARGLGDEIPAVIRPSDAVKNKDTVLKENMVFIVKPRAVRADGRTSAQMGDSVRVTATGGQRLGNRPLELIITD